MFKMSHKGEQVHEMFKGIAPRYDFLNRLLSFGVDIRWRKFAASLIEYKKDGKILDAATGTGDMALHIAAVTPASLSIVGMDFCKEMIDIARTKKNNSLYSERINLAVAPCEIIPFRDDTFDSVTIAFGIRNLDNRVLGLKEMYRVLRPGGKIVILEFSIPRNRLFGNIYQWYFRSLLPVVGGFFSKFSAYKYLPESVSEFPSRENFKRILADSGFTDLTHYDKTLGVVTLYTGYKHKQRIRSI
jgi:demethylmenaquinone methyltransferase/2-methoxy-6-polyprenyl-1,4-benzoquinol methylase